MVVVRHDAHRSNRKVDSGRGANPGLVRVVSDPTVVPVVAYIRDATARRTIDENARWCAPSTTRATNGAFVLDPVGHNIEVVNHNR